MSIQLTFCGTGAAYPTHKRSVSGLAVTLVNRTLLFDCGEATQMQLLRAGLNPMQIDLIALSHLHGDHLFGLPGLLGTVRLLGREIMPRVVGPVGLIAFLTAAQRVQRDGDRPLTLPVTEESAGGFSIEESGFTLSALPLDHDLPCFGYRIELHPTPGKLDVVKALSLGVPMGPMMGRLKAGEPVQLDDGRVIEPATVVGPSTPGRVICYVTDTRPCESAVTLARNADVLIHEATFDHSFTARAAEVGHSTGLQAAEIARAAGARHLILTHFSQRYTDVSPIVEEARTIFPDTMAAADFMRVEVTTLGEVTFS